MKNSYCTPTIATLLAASAAVATQAQTNTDLLVYYDFNTQTNLVVNDLSGNGQHGRLGESNNLATGGYTGQPGDNALNLLYQDRNVFVAPSTVSPGLSDWSISFWHKVTFAGIPHVIVGTETGFQIYGNRETGGIRLYPNGNTGTNGGGGSFTWLPNDKLWHHYAITIDRSTNERKLYVDGDLVSTVDMWAVTPSSQFYFTETYFGMYGGFPTDGSSLTDDYAVFGFALDPDQVEALASGTPVFDVVPEPGSLSLLGLSGLMLARRRLV